MERQQAGPPIDTNPGWGTDADPARRPGVPMELDPTRPRPGAQETVSRQPETVEILHRPELDRPTPVFGTAAPPRGLSGFVRRRAYGYPDHLSRKWMLLIAADRIDFVEHALLKRPAPVVVGLCLGAGAALLFLRRRQSEA